MFIRNLMSASIASILLTSSLAATANTQKDEEEDSVQSWGQWAKQYATAAGGELNTGALAFASLGQGETGRNAQNEAQYEELVQGLCQASSVCAISSFYAYNPNPEGDQFSTGDAPQITTIDNLEGGQIIVYDHDGVEIYRHSRTNNGGQVYYEDINRTMDIDGLDNGFHNIDENSDARTGVWFESENNFWNYGGGAWADGGEGWPDNGLGGHFVAGYTASLAAVEALSGDIDLSYSGYSRNGASVLIQIDMGSQTWAADFNKGAADISQDGRLRTAEFSVSGGKIDGINLIATTNNFSGGVTGEVQAAFFGQQAQEIGGVIDVVKSGKGYTDSFVAAQGGLEEYDGPQ
ncbi:hypothetical protein ACMXYV_12505 [Neptuniibacter sp. SY11_33]|uniref:hypothetical protein n=1 Tax=Neptuniibacter sp. SY11_33 TaxID=3398215 RepID=UPI0039F4D4DE